MGVGQRKKVAALAAALAILTTGGTAAASSGSAFGPPGVQTTVATGVTSTAATLHGTVNDEFEPTTYYFEYGTSAGYALSTSIVSSGSDGSDHAVAADISGLNSGATYHFRLVATNSSGTTYGSDQTLTTSPGPQGQATPVGALRVSARGVAVTLACAGGPCSGRIGLIAVERLRGRRIVGVKPVAAGSGAHSRSVLVGLKRYGLGDGATRSVTIELNALGRRLATAYKRVPLQVVIAIDAPRGYQGAIITRRVAYKTHR